MLPILCLAALVQSHSQHYNIRTCVNKDGTIRVSDPRISSTYLVENSHCTFLLDHYTGTIDDISFTRSSTNSSRALARLVLDDQIQINEKVNVTGEGEPFAMLPMYKTMPELTNITTKHVTVHVPGKAMVSFGKAEDPGLIFYGVVLDAYYARKWTYGHSVWWTYIHAGMFVAAIILWLSTDPSTASWSLYAWLSVSLVFDEIYYSSKVWSRIGARGGRMFVSVFVARLLFLAYLLYDVTEKPNPLCKWAPIPFKSRKLALCFVPFITGALLTAHVGAWLIMGRDALDDAKVVYYPVITGSFLLFSVLPAALIWKNGKSRAIDKWAKGLSMTGQLLLVTFVGIMLNVGAGALAPACMLYAFYRRAKAKEDKISDEWNKGTIFVVITVTALAVFIALVDIWD